jgi:Flp pilus assembly protein CpaB
MRLEGWPQATTVQAAILRDARKSALLRMRPVSGIDPPKPMRDQFIVGIENSAPSLTPEGQRAVTVLVLV